MPTPRFLSYVTPDLLAELNEGPADQLFFDDPEHILEAFEDQDELEFDEFINALEKNGESK